MLEEESGKITEEMVTHFKAATRDTNPIHREYVLGFQEEILLESRASYSAESEDPDYKCVRMIAEFRRVVPINSSYTLRLVPEDYTASHIEAALDVNGNDAVIAEFFYRQGGHLHPGAESLCMKTQEIEYQTKEDHARNGLKPSSYVLDKTDALRAGLGIGKTEEDYRALALGLASNALFRRSAEHKSKHSNILVYEQHDVIFTPAAHNLEAGEQVDIYTSIVPKQGTRSVTALVFAERKSDGLSIYSAELELLCIPEKVFRRLLKK